MVQTSLPDPVFHRRFWQALAAGWLSVTGVASLRGRAGWVLQGIALAPFYPVLAVCRRYSETRDVMITGAWLMVPFMAVAAALVCRGFAVWLPSGLVLTAWLCSGCAVRARLPLCPPEVAGLSVYTPYLQLIVGRLRKTGRANEAEKLLSRQSASFHKHEVRQSIRQAVPARLFAQENREYADAVLEQAARGNDGAWRTLEEFFFVEHRQADWELRLQVGALAHVWGRVSTGIRALTPLFAGSPPSRSESDWERMWGTYAALYAETDDLNKPTTALKTLLDGGAITQQTLRGWQLAVDCWRARDWNRMAEYAHTRALRGNGGEAEAWRSDLLFAFQNRDLSELGKMRKVLNADKTVAGFELRSHLLWTAVGAVNDKSGDGQTGQAAARRSIFAHSGGVLPPDIALFHGLLAYQLKILPEWRNLVLSTHGGSSPFRPTDDNPQLWFQSLKRQGGGGPWTYTMKAGSAAQADQWCGLLGVPRARGHWPEEWQGLLAFYERGTLTLAISGRQGGEPSPPGLLELDNALSLLPGGMRPSRRNLLMPSPGWQGAVDNEQARGNLVTGAWKKADGKLLVFWRTPPRGCAPTAPLTVDEGLLFAVPPGNASDGVLF